MKKYQEAIIAIILLIVMLVLGNFALLWWMRPVSLPDEGVWYCQELDVNLDFSGSRKLLIKGTEGGKEIFEVFCPYSGFLYFSDQQANSPKMFGYMCKKLIYSENSIQFFVEEQENKYTFVKVG